MTFSRRPEPELMDQPTPDPALLAESLADLAWLNRYLGGTATVVHQVRALLGDHPGRGWGRGRSLRVLDVGAGGGDILLSLARWCGRRGLSFEGVGLDLRAETVLIAATNCSHVGEGGEDITLIRGDARALPFAEGAFDVAFCSTFLHHLEPDDATAALREMARVSRLGIVVSDLSRSRSGYLAAWLLARTIWRGHPYARHDGPTSMRAAYTPSEARRMAERAGLSPVIVRQPGFRWALRWRRA